MQQTELTQLINKWQEGDSLAFDRLIGLVYDKLRHIALRQLSKERNNHTLQPTALVHEAFEKLVDSELTISNRAHFLSICSKVMRQILVDHARAKSRIKRDLPGVKVDSAEIDVQGEYIDLTSIDKIISELSKVDARKSQLAEMHYFGGMTQEDAAEVLGISKRTVERDLQFTKAWIQAQLT